MEELEKVIKDLLTINSNMQEPGGTMSLEAIAKLCLTFYSVGKEHSLKTVLGALTQFRLKEVNEKD